MEIQIEALLKLTTLLFVTILFGCGSVSHEQVSPNFDNMAAADARITLGLGYIEVGERSRAKENLDLALKYAPDYFRAHRALAYYYQIIGDIKTSIQFYQQALRSLPNNGDVLNDFAVLLCKYERYKEAELYFAKAFTQKDYYLVSVSYENAAFCLLKGGDKQTAERYFERSLAHDPNRYRSLLQLSKLKIEVDQLSKARVLLLRYKQRYGYDPVSLKLFIELENKAGNTQQVVHYGEVLASQFSKPALN
ncbi:type IV pilus biogenesis/stability protein PilW [Aliivibrio kagoshimensis]|uniref:type IV pilus biogenesis/stability protein PilW n=1 Tax=Aliivibrio kagoshimensis TaxID=2910230 RepID=UPI003D107880